MPSIRHRRVSKLSAAPSLPSKADHPCPRCGSEKWTYIDYGGCSECRSYEDRAVEDVERDLRDPQELGEYLMAVKAFYPDRSFSVIADMQGAKEVQDYDPNPVDHAALRDAELRDRAAQGDKFAAALLRGDTLAEEPTD